MPQLITIFGGSGFIGRHLVARLARTGARIRVAVCNPLLAGRIYPMGDPGQILAVRCNILNERQVAEAVKGADIVINLVGILHQSGSQRFDALQGAGAGQIARAAKAAGVKKFVQISAIGADANSDSIYARSKAEGERKVQESYPDALIVRPSIVFGAEDGFFNRFGRLAAQLPILPLFGGGENKVQPVYVGNVADAIAAGLKTGVTGTYELGGPRIYSFKELMQFVSHVTGRNSWLLPIPFWLGHIGAFFTGLLPSPVVTRDQLRLLAKDNVVSPGAKGLADLGVQQTAVEAVAPNYLAMFRKEGQFTDLRQE